MIVTVLAAKRLSVWMRPAAAAAGSPSGSPLKSMSARSFHGATPPSQFSISPASSAAEPYRSDFSRFRQRRAISASSGGTGRLGLARAGSGGSAVVNSFTSLGISRVWKGRFSVHSSYRTTPRDQTSERWSISSTRPAACSGDMYHAVPITAPSAVIPKE